MAAKKRSGRSASGQGEYSSNKVSLSAWSSECFRLGIDGLLHETVHVLHLSGGVMGKHTTPVCVIGDERVNFRKI